MDFSFTELGITGGMAGAVGSATGPVIAGMAFDLFGTYQGVFTGCILLSFIAAIAVYFSKPLAAS